MEWKNGNEYWIAFLLKLNNVFALLISYNIIKFQIEKLDPKEIYTSISYTLSWNKKVLPIFLAWKILQ